MRKALFFLIFPTITLIKNDDHGGRPTRDEEILMMQQIDRFSKCV